MSSRPRIYITRKIPAEAVEMLQSHFDVSMWQYEDQAVPREVLEQEAARADGLLTMLSDRVDDALLEKAPNLKVIANLAVGYDNIAVASCTRRGILVTNTPDVLTETTADLAWALLMAAARRIVEADRLVREGRWKSWAPMFMTGQDVYGATIGIVGMGAIGTAIARRARGFNMKILYHNRHRREEAERTLGAEYRDLDSLLRESDFVVTMTPLTPQTRGLIGERELSLMKPSAILINPGRGGVVDEDALYRALKEGRLWAAGLDVFAQEPVPTNHPLLTLPNVVVAPHIGSASIPTRTAMARLCAENLIAALTGGNPPTPVNPEVLKV